MNDVCMYVQLTIHKHNMEKNRNKFKLHLKKKTAKQGTKKQKFL